MEIISSRLALMEAASSCVVPLLGTIQEIQRTAGVDVLMLRYFVLRIKRKKLPETNFMAAKKKFLLILFFELGMFFVLFFFDFFCHSWLFFIHHIGNGDVHPDQTNCRE